LNNDGEEWLPPRARNWLGRLPQKARPGASTERVSQKVALWVPIQCSECGSFEQKQYGGPTEQGERYHYCLSCGVKFLSRPVTLEQLRNGRAR